MKIWLFTHNFPPEVNAVANRSFEHARQWVVEASEVQVITDVPHFPEGRVYVGYQNRFRQEAVEGVKIARVPSYIAPNRGRVRRILSYVTFMFSAVLHSLRLEGRPDVVVATSPQIFTALAGLVVSRLYRAPFVLEIRDLWPQSIRAVGAIRANLVLSVVQRVVDYLYREADRIVVVSEAFRPEIEKSGVDRRKIVYVPNGFEIARLDRNLSFEQRTAVLKKHNIGGGYVVCYIGTVGMAHALETVVEAARKSHDDDVFFVVVGAGAAWDGLAESSRGLKNFRLIEKLEREDALDLLAAADVSLIHLMDTPVFRTVIPSKTFEAMALGKPIILGVLGEAAALVERAEAGVVVQPESPEALNEAVQRLKLSTGEAERMGANGRSYVRENHSREELARKMIRVFEDVLQPSFV